MLHVARNTMLHVMQEKNNCGALMSRFEMNEGIPDHDMNNFINKPDHNISNINMASNGFAELERYTDRQTDRHTQE